MQKLIPPMDSEPPRDYVDFVVGNMPMLQAEANRLVGGDRHADQVYSQALIDVAGRWRRLSWQRRFSHRDTTADFLRRRLVARAEQWREDQIFPVEVVSVPTAPQFQPASHGSFRPHSPGSLRPATDAAFRPHFYAAFQPATHAAFQPDRYAAFQPAAVGATGPAAAPAAVPDSVAYRMAPLLPATVRADAGSLAVAGIAWEHAYRRNRMWRLGLRCAAVAFVVGEIVHVMSGLSGG